MPEIVGNQTMEQWLKEVGSGDTSTEKDDARMQSLLRKVGFSQAVCVCGIVYLEGSGTINAPPMPIQSMANQLVSMVEKVNEARKEGR